MKERMKYLNIKIQEKMNHIHYLTGTVVHSVQKLEYRLTYLIALKKTIDEYEKKGKFKHNLFLKVVLEASSEAQKIFRSLYENTFGNLSQKAYQNGILSKNEHLELSKVVEDRNELIHFFFKDIEFKQTDDQLALYLDERINFLEDLFSRTRRWYEIIKNKIKKLEK